MKKYRRIIAVLLLVFVCVFIASCSEIRENVDKIVSELENEAGSAVNETRSAVTKTTKNTKTTKAQTTKAARAETTNADDVIAETEIPEFTGSAYCELNGNKPKFTSSDMKKTAFEQYGELDKLGRCTTAFACIDKSLMPTGKRESISSVKPTGWKTVRYDFVEEHSLYNRSHLIGYQLTAENANKRNLVTGTRFMNAYGMTPFENMVADYIKETGNRVLYRVTPVFKGDELVCRGVIMEAKSVEDKGDGICYNVFVFNVQPYIDIDYKDGSSKISDGYYKLPGSGVTYTVNKNSRKIHDPECELAKQIKKDNKEDITCPIDALISQGYTKCRNCLG